MRLTRYFRVHYFKVIWSSWFFLSSALYAEDLLVGVWLMWETARKTRISTFHGFAVVKQRVAVTFQPHQSSKHLSIRNELWVATSQTMSDPGSTWSHIDHVLEEVEPGDEADLISVVEKWTRAAVFFFQLASDWNRLFIGTPSSRRNISWHKNWCLWSSLSHFSSVAHKWLQLRMNRRSGERRRSSCHASDGGKKR